MRLPFSSVPFLLPRSSTNHSPLPRARQRQVLARKTGVVGIAQLVRARSAEGDPVAIERHRNGLAVNVTDDEFLRSGLKRRRHEK